MPTQATSPPRRPGRSLLYAAAFVGNAYIGQAKAKRKAQHPFSTRASNSLKVTTKRVRGQQRLRARAGIRLDTAARGLVWGLTLTCGFSGTSEKNDSSRKFSVGISITLSPNSFRSQASWALLFVCIDRGLLFV
jgi:hypothetical protein